MKGPRTSAADFGNPTEETQYTLCLYDGRGGTPELVSSIILPPQNFWTSLGAKGYAYRDDTMSQDGIQRILLKAGDSGKPKILVQGATSTLTLPPAFSSLELFDQSPNVTMQIGNSEGACWGASYAPLWTKRNSAESFRAKRKY